jgi:dextranase
MLGKEYFPNENLSMKDDLKQAMIRYYDFLVAYENLLRDGGAFDTISVSCTNGKMLLNPWPPQIGQVSVVAKAFSNREVLHLINFNNANSLDWRDPQGTQQAPEVIQSATLSFTAPNKVSKIWIASPDINLGVATDLNFTQTGTRVTFTVPSLEYWDMVVIEY